MPPQMQQQLKRPLDETTKEILKELINDSFSFSRARMYLQSDQTIPVSTITKVAFNKTTYDKLGEVSTTNNNWTAKETGYYLIIAHVVFGKFANDYPVSAYLQVNGSNIAYSQAHTGNGSSEETLQVTDIRKLTDGDVVDFSVKTIEVSLTPKVYGGEHLSYLIIHKLSDLNSDLVNP